MVSVEVREIKVRNRVINMYLPVYEQKKEESIIVQKDAYTIKELFQRHLAGNQITAGQNIDSGNGAQDFSELSPLDFLEGDLVDIDTINDYIDDYQKRHSDYINKLKKQKDEKQQQSEQE